MSLSVLERSRIHLESKENIPFFPPLVAVPHVQVKQKQFCAALFDNTTEEAKILPAETRLSLIARAKQVRKDLSLLTSDEIDAVIEAERAQNVQHGGFQWYSVYAKFLEERKIHDAVFVPRVCNVKRKACKESSVARVRRKNAKAVPKKPAESTFIFEETPCMTVCDVQIGEIKLKDFELFTMEELEEMIENIDSFYS